MRKGYVKFEVDKDDYRRQKKSGVPNPKAKMILVDKKNWVI